MINILLTISCLIIIYIDIKYHKIFNIIAYPLMGIGIIVNLLIHGWVGIVYSLIGFIAGICMCFLPLKIKACKYGEFKFMGLIGILKGYNFVVLIGIISYVLILIFQFLNTFASGAFKTLLSNSKLYLNLILQYGISINTILEEILKPLIIPYSIIVFISTIIGMLIEKM